jgi:sulfonate transport system substrate-binding protein
MKRIFSSLVTLVLALAALGTTAGFAADYPKVIRIGQVAGSFNKPVSTGAIGYVQANRLFEEEFKKEGITFEFVYIRAAGPGIQEALANNALDFGQSGDLPSIAGRASGLKTRAIAGSRGGNTYVAVPADSSIKTIKDIKGKKVGVSLGTYYHAALLKILKDNGLTDHDVKLVNMDNSTIKIAVATKDIDVAFMGNDAFTLRDTGLARIIGSTKNLPVWYQSTGELLVRDEFARKYPDIVKRFVKVFVKGSQLASQNKNATLKFNTRNGSSLAQLKEDSEGVPAIYSNSPKLDEQWLEHTKKSIVLYKQHGLIRRTFDAEKEWIDRSFLDAALKELNLENYWPDYDVNGNKKKK